MIKIIIKFKPKSTFNPRSKDAAIEIYLSSLKKKTHEYWNSERQIQQSYTSEAKGSFYFKKMTKLLLSMGVIRG